MPLLEQVGAAVVKIYEAVRNSFPWDVACVRTKHTVWIHCKLFRNYAFSSDFSEANTQLILDFSVASVCPCSFSQVTTNGHVAHPR
ncbi:Ankyrin repeat protein [Mycena indigotica]|uniref:Ankyrin repeat protein n=1 Tax=Mycena indigotica TaxID=2126181 RepID=A0A8H6W2Z3_9AGAR|nr:Ankyrin repeat protein [Mycena indigotica]KAF7300976.1 Ankyrin repeat protein [Mycena indigotica]